MPTISKSKLKLFASLQLKKFRQSERRYLAEGIKILQEALQMGVLPEAVIISEQSREKVPDSWLADLGDRLFICNEKELSRLSSQKNPEGVVSVFPYPEEPRYYCGTSSPPPQCPAIILYQVRDPGNLGTLIRTADWFDFKRVICSPDTAELFNSKVIRSAMGSAFRVQVHYYEDLDRFIEANADKIWLADMEGEAPHSLKLGSRPYLLLGNEANGVPEHLRNLPGIGRVSIPRMGQAESLNVAMAGAILSYEYQRQTRFSS